MKFYFELTRPNKVMILARQVEKNGSFELHQAVSMKSKPDIRQFVEDTLKIYPNAELYRLSLNSAENKKLEPDDLITRLEKLYDELSGAMSLH